jgi:hypothetical protein
MGASGIIASEQQNMSNTLRELKKNLEQNIQNATRR